MKFNAGDIYLGKNYKKSINEGIKYFNCEDDFYILSAKYGLLSKNDKISYYDKYLGNFSTNDKKEWADNVIKQLKQKFDLSNTEFVIFAANSYSKYIKDYLNCIILKFKRRDITFEIKEKLNNSKQNIENQIL